MSAVDVGAGLVTVGVGVGAVFVGVVGVGALVLGAGVVGPPGLRRISRTSFRVHLSKYAAPSTYKHWE
jgi:hypothetical protein